MKTESVKICVTIAILIVLAAAQDMAPCAFAVKPPLLLVFGCTAGAPAAAAAGFFTDALGGLPFGCSAVFFVAAALLCRVSKTLAFPAVVAAAGAYQVWLLLWGGNVPLHSIYASVAYVCVLFPAAKAVFVPFKRHLGIDGNGKERAQ